MSQRRFKLFRQQLWSQAQGQVLEVAVGGLSERESRSLRERPFGQKRDIGR